MNVHDADQVPTLPGSVVTIGAFDGVHQGHQAVIRQTIGRSKLFGVPSVVYTFDPPPRCYFQGARMLTTVEEKLARFAALGIDHVVIARFDQGYALRRAERFIQDLASLSPLEIIVGQDFRFGRNREGDLPFLNRHFPVRVAQPVCCSAGRRISSTRIRDLIARGETEQSAALLRWPPQ